MEQPADLWPQFGTPENKPVTCILIGMAGTGKTTFMQRVNAYVHERNIPSYIINLDPAVATIPYTPNIDIRDSLNYKEVMKQYGLGPNGGILTSLNLYSTRFDQVMGFVEKRAPNLKYIFADTPGQIEVFNWSASGSIITETFATQFPTCLVYVVDTPRCANPSTFMSNMLYACSMLYKTKLPLVLVFNKTDIMSHEFAVEWMTDFDAFESAVRSKGNYMGTLTQSMGLMLEEFYKSLRCVGVSAVTGSGMDEFFKAVHEAAHEYNTEYKPDMDKRIAERQEKERKRMERDVERVKADIAAAEGIKNLTIGSDLGPSIAPGAFASDDDDDEMVDEDYESREEYLADKRAFEAIHKANK